MPARTHRKMHAAACALLLLVAAVSAQVPRAVKLQNARLRCDDNLPENTLRITTNNETWCAPGYYTGRESRVYTTLNNIGNIMPLSKRLNGTCNISTAGLCQSGLSPFFWEDFFLCMCKLGTVGGRDGGPCVQVPNKHVSPPNSNDSWSCSAPNTEQDKRCQKADAFDLNLEIMKISSFIYMKQHAQHGKDLYKEIHSPCGAFMTDDCVCREGFHKEDGQCLLCPMDHYCQNETKHHCGRNVTMYQGAATRNECVLPAVRSEHRCPAGKHDRGGVCVPCKRGFWCASGGATACPDNATTHSVGMTAEANCTCRGGFTTYRAEGHVVCVRNPACARDSRGGKEPRPPREPLDWAHSIEWFAPDNGDGNDGGHGVRAVVLDYLRLVPQIPAKAVLDVFVLGEWKRWNVSLDQLSKCDAEKLYVTSPAPPSYTATVVASCAASLNIWQLIFNTDSSAETFVTVFRQKELALLPDSPRIFSPYGRALFARAHCQKVTFSDFRNTTVNALEEAGNQTALANLSVYMQYVRAVIKADNLNVTNETIIQNYAKQFRAARVPLPFFPYNVSVDDAKIQAHSTYTECKLELVFLDATEDPMRVEVALPLGVLLSLNESAWGSDGYSLALNSSVYVDVDQLRQNSTVLRPNQGAVPREPDTQEDIDCDRCEPSDAPQGTDVCAPCSEGLVMYGGRCTACPADQVCRGDERMLCKAPRYQSDDGSLCMCPAGQIESADKSACHNVPKGWYRSAQQTHMSPCPANKTTANDGSTGVGDCLCRDGFRVDGDGCTAARKGYYVNNSISTREHKCEGMRTTLKTGRTRQADCVCPAGYYEHESKACLKCTQNFACAENTTGLANATQCQRTWSLLANFDNSRCVCPQGYYRVAWGESTDPCIPCGYGFYCDEATDVARTRCPAGMSTREHDAYQKSDCFCIGRGTTKSDDQMQCTCDSKHRFEFLGGCVPCGQNMQVHEQNHEMCRCEDGYHWAVGSSECVLCSPGAWCTHNTAHNCPAGFYGVYEGQAVGDDCLPCASYTRAANVSEAARVYDPPHLACLESFVRVQGDAMRWDTPQSATTLTGPVQRYTDVRYRVKRLKTLLRTPNITLVPMEYWSSGLTWTVVLTQHPRFSAALFKYLKRVYPHTWNGPLQTMRNRDDWHVIMGAYFFCRLISHGIALSPGPSVGWKCSLSTQWSEALATIANASATPLHQLFESLHSATMSMPYLEIEMAAPVRAVNALVPASQTFMFFPDTAPGGAGGGLVAGAEFGSNTVPESILRKAKKYPILGVQTAKTPCGQETLNGEALRDYYEVASIDTGFYCARTSGSTASAN